MLDGELMRGLLDAENERCGVIALKTVDSTNLEAKRRISAGEALPILIAAEGQTAGRGRLGRSFESPDGTGVYFSLAFRAEGGVEGTVLVTTAAAVAAREAVSRETGLECGIKWVNDLYLGGKKVCGILAEAVGDRIIVGVGINITTEFSGELADKAGSLGKPCRREALAAWTAAGILRFLRGGMPDMLERYRRASIVIGRRVTVIPADGETREALAAGIAEDGGLIIETRGGGEEILRTGEISIRMENYI